MAVTPPVYLDNQATTRVDPRVLEVMMPYFGQQYGNAASRSHVFGWAAEAAVERAREQIADLLGGSASEIVFTSGATEADNLALVGAARANRSRGNHLVTVATEHRAVLDTARELERSGTRVTILAPQRDGLVTPDAVAEAVGDDTAMVSVMFVNNEIGVVQPIADIVAAIKAKNRRTLVHCDAAQGAGKLSFNAVAIGVDLVSLSAHKMYGPKGVGALWVRRRPRVRLEPLVHGGGHERGLRSGTLPVPLIVGFGAACEIAAREMHAEAERIGSLRDQLLAGLRDRLDGLRVNGSLEDRLPGNLNVSFAGVQGEALLMALRDVAVSSGAACSTARRKPSHVLAALGVEDRLAQSTIRFAIGRFNSGEEIEYVIDRVVRAVSQLRAVEGCHGASEEAVATAQGG